MYWTEPRAISRLRLKIVRKNCMPWHLNVSFVIGFLLTCGGIAFAIMDRSNHWDDRAALLAFLGVIIMTARFMRNAFTVTGVSVAIRNDGISINDGILPNAILWQESILFSVDNYKCGSKDRLLFDIAWRKGEGVARYLFGVPSQTDAERVKTIPLEHGAKPHPDLDQIVPEEATDNVVYREFPNTYTKEMPE